MSKVTSNFKKLKPFVVEQNRRSNLGSNRPIQSVSSTLTSHALNGAFHTGTLDISKVPDALDKTGDTITGNILVDPGVEIDGVDISSHAADDDAQHTAFTTLVSDSGSASPISALIVVSGTGVLSTNATSSTINIALANDSTLSTVGDTLGVDQSFGFSWTNEHTFNASLALEGNGSLVYFDKSNDDTGSIGFDFSNSELTILYDTANNLLNFSKSGTDIFTIDRDSAYVGVLNNAPSAPLDVAGQILSDSLQVDGNVDILSSGDLTVGANVLFVDASGSNVGINKAPDAQFQLDVNGNTRTSGYFALSDVVIFLSVNRGRNEIVYICQARDYTYNFPGF